MPAEPAKIRLRFALIRHRLPASSPRPDHYDLLLEWNGQLLTWEILSRPLLAEETLSARRLPEHRLLYLDYSGPLTGDRGQVEQVARGDLVWDRPPRGEQPTSPELAAPDDRLRAEPEALVATLWESSRAWQLTIHPPLELSAAWRLTFRRLA